MTMHSAMLAIEFGIPLGNGFEDAKGLPVGLIVGTLTIMDTGIVFEFALRSAYVSAEGTTVGYSDIGSG